MRFIRDSRLYAYLLGFYERFRFGDAFGRTHESSCYWNDAYDRGANLADWIGDYKG